jgi:RimJ/RimL family protein N-acetyltransferase
LASPIFRTQHLLGRRLEGYDVADMLEVYGDADAMRWVGDGEPLNEVQCIQWVDVTENNYRSRGYGMFTLVDAACDDVVGFCGLVQTGGRVDAEIKYALKRRNWGRGLATDGVRAMLDYGARVHGLRTVIATTAPGNLASQRVLQKAGMSRAQSRRNDDGSTTLVFSWTAPGSP